MLTKFKTFLVYATYAAIGAIIIAVSIGFFALFIRAAAQ